MLRWKSGKWALKLHHITQAMSNGRAGTAGGEGTLVWEMLHQLPIEAKWVLLGIFKGALVNFDSIDPSSWSQNLLGGIPKERLARTFDQLRFIGLSDVLLKCVLNTLLFCMFL